MEKRNIILIFVIFINIIFGYWVKEQIGPFSNWVSGIVIAKGRNDDTNRIYVATWTRLYELTYRNNRWDILDMGITNGWGVCAGDGRNDGRIRIYATFTTVSPQYGGVYEYTWTGTGWQREIIATFPSSPRSSAGIACAIGKGRNDGINRIYSTDGNNQRLFESSWDGQRWNTTQIFDSSGVDIIIAPARRDGINRIYFVGQGTTIKELSWDGNRWVYQPVDPNVRYYYGITCGYGRNDTILRLYSGLGSSPYAVYEFTWNGNEWVKERVKGFPTLPRCLFLGDGRNEEKINLYVGYSRAMEYSYNFMNNQWDSCWVDSAGGTGSYVCVCIGDARNEGINRVYFGSSNYYLYEFSYISTQVKEKESYFIIIPKNKYYNSVGQVISNYRLKKGIYFIYEKGRLKKFVKIK